jgi:hypothetical protein
MRAAADELVGREVERWDANFISPFAVRAAATVFGTDAITYHEGSQELPMTTDQAAASTARVQEQTNRGETAERLEDYSIQARIDLVRYAEHRAAEASVPEVSNGETERDVNMVYQLDPVRETGRLVATTDVGTLTRMVEVDAATGELTSPRGRADIRGYIEQGEQVAADLTNQAARELAARGVVRWDDTYSTAGEVAVAEQVFGSERITYYDFSPRDQYDNIEIPLPMTAEQAAASAERSEDELEGVWAHVDLQGLARPTEARAREVDLEQSRSGRDVEVVSTESCDVTIDRSYPDQSSADRLVESALADTLLEGWEPIDANPANPDTNRKYYVDDPANPTFFAKRTTPPLYEFDHPLGLGAAEVHQAAAVAAVVDSPEAQAIVRANDFTGISYVRPILSVTDTDFAVETTIYSWQAGRILAPSDVTKPFPPGSEPERAEMAENQLADLLQSNGIIAYDLNVRQLLATDDAPGGSQLHLIDAEQFQITIDHGQ